MALESDGARAQIQAVYPWQANCRFFSVKWEPQCHLMLNETSAQNVHFRAKVAWFLRSQQKVIMDVKCRADAGTTARLPLGPTHLPPPFLCWACH